MRALRQNEIGRSQVSQPDHSLDFADTAPGAADAPQATTVEQSQRHDQPQQPTDVFGPFTDEHG